MDQNCKIGALYIASLKAIALIHTHNHWTAKGIAFYSDHLLFERIYNDTLKNLDEAAEKFMGLFGEECLNYDLQADLLHKVLLKYSNLEGSPVEMALQAEKQFLKLSQDAYDAFEKAGVLTLGLSDMIPEIASKREEVVYLLQQTLDQN